ncbi:hypothetical protein GCK72_005076 [Caenorhabditis remanei]|uniref:CRE-DYLT-3 protein n=1 Tax=Caenorhabditis remanei TaxID=31234 RepID=E3LGT1_CAERE|nr:hypothetical protein GCK72_005076 [Caenorhabditis remanei]EFO85788.1 CRE-DYLT-3 protein [Caenorhabditis remanei]KAF1765124.1 hypothetical protein GCK72_005076 [Caenorhabditis remanei]
MTDTSSVSSTSSHKPSVESDDKKLLRALIEKKNKKKNQKKKKAFSNAEEQAIDLIVQKTFDSVIGKDQYSPLKTTEWMSKIIQKISKALVKREETRKFVVQCTICSKTEELSICSANMCSWDTSKDVAVYSEWISKTVFGAVQVFFITHRFSKRN